MFKAVPRASGDDPFVEKAMKSDPWEGFSSKDAF